MDNIASVITKFAKKINRATNYQFVYNELLIHPEYPSLLAISDVLNTLKVPNKAFKINNADLKNLTCPFIAHTVNKGNFTLVNQIKGDHVIISDDKVNNLKLPLADFERLFDGVILTADVNIASPVSFKRILSSSKIPLAFVALSIILLLTLVFKTNYFINITWQTAVLTLFKSAGLLVSTLLLIQSIDSNNPLIKRLCQDGDKTNCNAILSSNAAKVMEGLTWSEVGFFYFAGTWLLLLLNSSSPGVWQIMLFLNVAGLPYTVYSIYYQARVAKKWCVLCCTVQALLWLEFIPLVTSFQLPVITPSPAALSSLFIALLLPVALWVLLKPLLLKTQEIIPLKNQLHASKYNAEIFNNMLTAQPKYAQPAEEWCIVLGNTQAKNVITMVTNPYCGPCGKAHKLLHKLLENRDDIQARIVFTADNTETDLKTPVSRHLMTLHGLPDKTAVNNALTSWYDRKQQSYATWAKQFPVMMDETEYNKLDKQKAWCDMAQVKSTPTILVNGYTLPDLYQLTDLKYLLEYSF